MKYIINTAGIVFFQNARPIKIEKSSPQYPKIVKAFDLPEDQQEDAIAAILNREQGDFEYEGFQITPEDVFYQGERLPTALANKVRSIAQEDLPLTLFVKFWDNIQANPSASSVRELYDFLAYRELPITEDGCFIAYKGVDMNGWSISGNKKTKVLKGKTNGYGQIYNGVGEEIEVRRWDVDDNRQNHCSFGLHVGSLDYAQDFAQGNVVIVKVNPKDVVSVPSDCSCQKCRVSAYKVIDMFECEIEHAATDEDGEPILSEDRQEYDQFVNRIDRYLQKNPDREITIRSIQNSFSPQYPCKVRVLDALGELGYVWGVNEEGTEVVFS